MTNVRRTVRRVRIIDGVDKPLTSVVGGTDILALVGAHLVVSHVGPGYVEYDVELIYHDGGALTTMEYTIKSALTSEGTDIDEEILQTGLTVATLVASDIHKTDSTNGRVITNILIATVSA